MLNAEKYMALSEKVLGKRIRLGTCESPVLVNPDFWYPKKVILFKEKPSMASLLLEIPLLKFSRSANFFKKPQFGLC